MSEVIELDFRQLDDADVEAKTIVPATEAELRLRLRDAIEIQKAAEQRADAAKETARRAEAHRLEAREYVNTFRKGHEAKMREARDAHAKIVSEAIRAGRHVPGRSALPAVDTVALEAAQGQYDALEVSATYLAVEAQEAAADTGKAAEAVRAAATAVMDCDMQRKHAEALAAIEILRKLEEELSGFHLLDEARPGGAKFTALKDEIVVKLNRQQALAAERPELQERWKYNRYIDGLNADARQRWQDYHRRLCLDAEASFDDREESSQ